MYIYIYMYVYVYIYIYIYMYIETPRRHWQGDENKVKEAEDKLVRQAEEIEALEATVRAGFTRNLHSDAPQT